MIWTVIWDESAEDDLARFWLKAVSRRQAITRSQAEIDEILRNSPLSRGNAISEGLFELTVAPLRAFFEVSESDRLIRVTAIGVIDR